MKYAFIQRNRRVWPISVQCRVLRVSVSGYHEHLVRRRDILRRRHLSDEALLVHTIAEFCLGDVTATRACIPGRAPQGFLVPSTTWFTASARTGIGL